MVLRNGAPRLRMAMMTVMFPTEAAMMTTLRIYDFDPAADREQRPSWRTTGSSRSEKHSTRPGRSACGTSP